jgi:hypothetical protein
MTARIIKGSEPIRVTQQILCIYGQPGIGKSSLGFSADDPLLLDFDAGAHRTGKFRRDSVPFSTWEEAAELEKSFFSGYKTCIVDTGGRALDLITIQLIREDPKMGRGGVPSLQGYGKLKAVFTSWLKMIRSFGLDVVILAHSTEDKSGDDILVRLDIQGGSKGEIYKSSDAMGQLYIRGNKRVLNFSPTDAAFGKNPGQLPLLEVPSFDPADKGGDPRFLGGVIQRIKDHLNKLTEAQAEIVKAMEEWTGVVEAVADAEDQASAYSALAETSKGLPEEVRAGAKAILVKAAKEAGFEWSKEYGRFAKE